MGVPNAWTTGGVSHLSLEYKVPIILSVFCEDNLKITTLVKNKYFLQRSKLGFSLSLNKCINPRKQVSLCFRLTYKMNKHFLKIIQPYYYIKLVLQGFISGLIHKNAQCIKTPSVHVPVPVHMH